MDAIKELKEYDGYVLSEQYKIRHRVIQEIKQLRLANSDLQMYYDYAKDEVLKLEAEVNRMRYALDKYDCLHRCTEPCALYAMEKERENDFPHMICGWWASSALKEEE
jgi:hypothetical protein